MGIQIFDSNNDLVTPVDPIASPDQQVADISGNIINPAEEDGNLLSVKTNTDNLDVSLASRATETTLSSIDSTLTTQLDVLLSTRATEATLSTLDSKFSALGQNTSANSTPVVLASDQSAIPIQGVDTVGDPVTEIPVTIAGIDESGNKRILATDDAGQVLLRNRGVIDTNNSSTTPLGAGATFTGTVTEILDFSHISVYIFTDQDSASEGLIVEWSQDGTNFDENDMYTISANDGKLYSFGPPSRYFRIRYINGATPQTTFRLQTILHTFSTKSSSHRLSDDLSAEDDAELVISVIKARTPSGAVSDVDGVPILGQNHLAVVSANVLLEQAVLNHTYTTTTDFNLPSGGTESPVLLIRNPAGSGKALYMSRTFLDILTKGNQATWRVYITPTVTATGTPVTVGSTHIGGGAPASVMTVYSGPTVSAMGIKALTMSTGVDASTSPIGFDLGTIVEPGFDLLVTGVPSANNTSTAITISWVEE